MSKIEYGYSELNNNRFAIFGVKKTIIYDVENSFMHRLCVVDTEKEAKTITKLLNKENGGNNE